MPITITAKKLLLEQVCRDRGLSYQQVLGLPEDDYTEESLESALEDWDPPKRGFIRNPRFITRESTSGRLIKRRKLRQAMRVAMVGAEQERQVSRPAWPGMNTAS